MELELYLCEFENISQRTLTRNKIQEPGNRKNEEEC